MTGGKRIALQRRYDLALKRGHFYENKILGLRYPRKSKYLKKWQRAFTDIERARNALIEFDRRSQAARKGKQTQRRLDDLPKLIRIFKKWKFKVKVNSFEISDNIVPHAVQEITAVGVVRKQSQIVEIAETLVGVCRRFVEVESDLNLVRGWAGGVRLSINTESTNGKWRELADPVQRPYTKSFRRAARQFIDDAEAAEEGRRWSLSKGHYYQARVRELIFFALSVDGGFKTDAQWPRDLTKKLRGRRNGKRGIQVRKSKTKTKGNRS